MGRALLSLQITVQPAGWQLDGDLQQTLLQSAIVAGVTLPNSCRNGTCRTCMCQLTAGSVRYRIDWPGVSREEKQDGWILPCVAYPESDVTITAPLARKT